MFNVYQAISTTHSAHWAHVWRRFRDSLGASASQERVRRLGGVRRPPPTRFSGPGPQVCASPRHQAVDGLATPLFWHLVLAGSWVSVSLVCRELHASPLELVLFLFLTDRCGANEPVSQAARCLWSTPPPPRAPPHFVCPAGAENESLQCPA